MAFAGLPFVLACGALPPAVPPPVAATTPVQSAADLHCSLPVVTATRAGFIDLPSATFRADPQAPPPQHNFGLTYSFGAHRWVTTLYGFGYGLLSPDGRAFVEAQGPPMYSGSGQPAAATDLYLVDVTTLKRKKIGSVPGRARPIAYRQDGIYLDEGAVLRFDPATGRYVNIGRPPASSFSGWFWITSAGAWSSLIAVPNQSDRNPVLSMSLQDGSVKTWYTSPAERSVSILGFVKPDEPLLVEFNREPYDHMTGLSFMLLTAPGAKQSLNFDPAIVAWGFTDTAGVWLDSPGHVWLYNESGLLRIADVSGSIGNEIPNVVGPFR